MSPLPRSGDKGIFSIPEPCSVSLHIHIPPLHPQEVTTNLIFMVLISLQFFFTIFNAYTCTPNNSFISPGSEFHIDGSLQQLVFWFFFLAQHY